MLVDVVWQVDQDLENGSSEYRQPPFASTSTSQVSCGSAAPASAFLDSPELTRVRRALQRPEDKAAYRAKIDLVSRDLLAELVHSLFVRRQVSLLCVRRANDRRQTAGILDAATCRERLDVRLLASRPLQLLQVATNFRQFENRARTAL